MTWDSHTYESAYDSPEVASYFEGDDEQRRWSVPASPSLAGGGSAVESPLTAKQLEKSRAFDWPDIPAGYALAQILPGKTIRLQLHVPRRLYWRTGQHVSLTIPAVRFWQGHPFTICVADDRITHRSAEFKDGGCYLQILARVKGGFTKALWNKLHSLTEASPAPVLLRAQVGWPLGSNKGARIQDFSTVIVLCGGSGISFGVGVFEHACHALAGRVGKNSKVQRIKLIWLLREFGTSNQSQHDIWPCRRLADDLSLFHVLLQRTSLGLRLRFTRLSSSGPAQQRSLSSSSSPQTRPNRHPAVPVCPTTTQKRLNPHWSPLAQASYPVSLQNKASSP